MPYSSCPACNGTGRQPGGRSCWGCNGNGIVEIVSDEEADVVRSGDHLVDRQRRIAYPIQATPSWGSNLLWLTWMATALVSIAALLAGAYHAITSTMSWYGVLVVTANAAMAGLGVGVLLGCMDGLLELSDGTDLGGVGRQLVAALVLLLLGVHIANTSAAFPEQFFWQWKR